MRRAWWTVVIVGLFASGAWADEPQTAPDEEAFVQELPPQGAPPPGPADPVEPAAPAPAPPAAAPDPAGPPPPAPGPDDTVHAFLDNWTAFAMQYGTGVAASFVCCGGSGIVGAVVGAVLFVIPGGVIWSTLWLSATGCPSALLAPAGGVSLGVWLREWWGGQRSAWGWSLLAAYATEVAAIAVLAVGTFAGALLTTPFFSSIIDFSQSNPLNPPAQWNWTSLAGGGALAIGAFSVGLVAAILAPSLSAATVYTVLGEDKAADDVGFRVPGVFSSNHPDPETPPAPQKLDRPGRSQPY